MQKRIIRLLTVLVGMFLAMTFVYQSWNPTDWGLIGRAVFITLTISIDFTWRRLEKI